jgi:hypothetical protein
MEKRSELRLVVNVSKRHSQKRKKKTMEHRIEYGISAMTWARPKTGDEYILDDASR